MAQELPRGTTVDVEDVTMIDGPEEFAQETGVNIDQTLALFDKMEIRAAHRDTGHMDMILRIEPWMQQFWQDDYETEFETPFLLAKKVQDYSPKAYKLNGAAHVQLPAYEMDEPITAGIKPINHSTVEFEKDLGEDFIAKSGVTEIYVVQQ